MQCSLGNRERIVMPKTGGDERATVTSEKDRQSDDHGSGVVTAHCGSRMARVDSAA